MFVASLIFFSNSIHSFFRMNLHVAVQRIVFDNPTFLLADDLRLDVRSNIEYSKLDRASNGLRHF